jgi:hypothetical protein
MRGDDVREAVEAAVSFLRPHAGRDWSVPVPELDFTVASVVAHAGEGPLWYSVDLTGGPENNPTFGLKIRADAEPGPLINCLNTAARVCAATVDIMPGTARGFHPMGIADPSGFAAMACDEILVHTHDAGTGLGKEFRPDPGLVRRLLERLFPWHDPGTDAWSTLLWANGRVDLPGAPQRRRWRWHCAPLAEWDGNPPVIAS